MGIRQVAFLGYGITDFNYKDDMNNRVTINFFDEEVIKNYLKEHSLEDWLKERHDDEWEHLDANWLLHMVDKMKRESKNEENYLDKLTDFICSYFRYEDEYGLKNVLCFNGMTSKENYENFIVEELLRKMYGDEEWNVPRVILLNHPIWPECCYCDSSGKYYSYKDYYRSDNKENMFPAVPSEIILILKFLNFFKDEKEYLKIRPMLYFYNQ